MQPVLENACSRWQKIIRALCAEQKEINRIAIHAGCLEQFACGGVGEVAGSDLRSCNMTNLNSDFALNLGHVPVRVLCLKLLICDNTLGQVRTDPSDKRLRARLQSHSFYLAVPIFAVMHSTASFTVLKLLISLALSWIPHRSSRSDMMDNQTKELHSGTSAISVSIEIVDLSASKASANNPSNSSEFI